MKTYTHEELKGIVEAHGKWQRGEGGGTRADLSGAYLSGAYLSGAKWREGVIINKVPIQLFGLHWRVTILDEHMQIGCELHKLTDWEEYDDKRIAEMDGRAALRFWRNHKDVLLGLAKSAARGATEDKTTKPA